MSLISKIFSLYAISIDLDLFWGLLHISDTSLLEVLHVRVVRPLNFNPDFDMVSESTRKFT